MTVDGAEQTLHCWVYGSNRKDEMYLYLARKEGFEDLPAELRQRFGQPRLVMELDLNPCRSLAREDVNRVLDNLRQRGFHLQLPPRIQAEIYHDD